MGMVVFRRAFVVGSLAALAVGCSSNGHGTTAPDGGSGSATTSSGGGKGAGTSNGMGGTVASAGGASMNENGGVSGDPGSGGASGSGTSENGGTAGASGGASGGAPTTESGDASIASCPASDPANASHGQDTFTPNTGKTEVSALTYTNVGASGAYDQVVTGWSKATGCVGDTNGMLCDSEYRMPKQVSGALAPFNEEMTPVFAGPVELYHVAVYVPGNGGWNRTAYWDRCTTDGLVFAGNKHWYECGGFVESYVTADGTKESATPVQFSGSIAAGTEVNVMSSALCNGSTASSDCGWSSGIPLHGFAGDASGSKIFATEFRMPLGTKTPAYWILPSQVIRSSQYGCNCRGEGSDPTYKGGCGELDVAEILGGVTTSVEATTTLYSFQDITGGGSVAFDRPVNDSAVFLVIFDAKSSQIAIRRLDATAFSFAGMLSDADVGGYLANAGTTRALE
jgi:hypothetical protein